jgi:hypothetical protein
VPALDADPDLGGKPWTSRSTTEPNAPGPGSGPSACLGPMTHWAWVKLCKCEERAPLDRARWARYSLERKHKRVGGPRSTQSTHSAVTSTAIQSGTLPARAVSCWRQRRPLPPHRPRHAASPSSPPDGRRAPSALARPPNSSPLRPVRRFLTLGHLTRQDPHKQVKFCRAATKRGWGPTRSEPRRGPEFLSSGRRLDVGRGTREAGEGLRQTLRGTPSGAMSVGDSFRRTLMPGLDPACLVGPRCKPR